MSLFLDLVVLAGPIMWSSLERAAAHRSTIVQPQIRSVIAPTGVWRNIEEGIVVRFSACADKYCAVVVGVPPTVRSRRDAPTCGTEFLSGFTWNSAEKRWEGKLRVPDGSRSLSARLKTDGTTMLSVTARMALFSKTLTFEPLREGSPLGCPQ